MAHDQGKPITDNPWPAGGVECAAWSAGWVAAQIRGGIDPAKPAAVSAPATQSRHRPTTGLATEQARSQQDKVTRCISAGG